MKKTKFAVFTIFFLAAMAANATTYKCQTTEGNTPAVAASLETNWWGNKLYSGTFSYTDPVTSEKRDNKFACLPANGDGVTECGAINTDPNILRILSDAVMGFEIQFKDQKTITLFTCTEKTIRSNHATRIFR